MAIRLEDIEKRQYTRVSVSNIISNFHSKGALQGELSKGYNKIQHEKPAYHVKNPQVVSALSHTSHKSLSSFKHDPTLSSTVLAIRRANANGKMLPILAARNGDNANKNGNILQKKALNIENLRQFYRTHNSELIGIHSQENKGSEFFENTFDKGLQQFARKETTCNRSTDNDNWHSTRQIKCNTKQSSFEERFPRRKHCLLTMSETPSTDSPPPPPCAPPPPPPPPAPFQSTPANRNTASKPSDSGNSNDRSALLTSIQKGTKLKPTVTRDCSSPLLSGSSRKESCSSSTGNIGNTSGANKSYPIEKNADFNQDLQVAINRPLRKTSTNQHHGADRKFSLADGFTKPQKIQNEPAKFNEHAVMVSSTQTSIEKNVQNVSKNTIPMNGKTLTCEKIMSNNQDKNSILTNSSSKNHVASPLTPSKTDQISTSHNRQECEKNVRVDKSTHVLRQGSVQDKAYLSAVVKPNESTAADSDFTGRKKKISVDILKVVEAGPNLQSKGSTNRNFGERMAALQEQGKLVSREEHQAKMQHDQTRKDSVASENQTGNQQGNPSNISWKSEYSVSNEASKSAGSMFGLSDRQSSSISSGLQKPSELYPQKVSPTTIGKATDTSNVPLKTRKDSTFINTYSSSKITPLANLSNPSKKSSKPISKGKTMNPDDVKICSCVENATLDGSHKCSHSDPSAIHLNMDNVMKFLGEIKE